MFRFLCIAAAACLLLSACEKKTETAPETAPKPAETTAPAPAAQPPAGQPPAGQPPAAGEQPAGAVSFEGLGYQIDMAAGEKVYNQVCSTCHREGVAGAPKIGDTAAWQPRLAQGAPVLVEHSIKGFQGNQGVMPPKGGAQSLTDAEVASAVAYMVQQVNAAPAAK